MRERDLCFAVDGTRSMSHFLSALRDALPQFLQLTRLVDGAVGRRMAVLVYRDYDAAGPVVEFSGWGLDVRQLGEFVRSQTASGGGDNPEAAKTAAWRLLRECAARPCVVLWYCDAPPHHAFAGSCAEHYAAEKAQAARSGDPFDWVEICRRFAAARHEVHVFLSVDTAVTAGFYCLLTALTGGRVLYLRSATAAAIGRHSVGALLTVAGHAYDFAGDVERLSSTALDDDLGPRDIPDIRDIRDIRDEHDCRGVLPARSGGTAPVRSERLFAIAGVDAGLDARFASDAAYRDVVYGAFESVLMPDMIEALTYNTVFGGLWRAVCRDRGDARRDALAGRMGDTVSQLAPGAKHALRAFIEASYDRSEEIARLVAAAPNGIAGPCVVLDSAAALSRSELLELGRSCSRGALAKVGALLTGLRIVGSGGGGGRPAIPLSTPGIMALLPHLMCPGTMLSARPAAVLAVLAVVTHTAPALRERAVEHLERVKGAWIDLEKPECLSSDFVRLVLRAPQHLTAREAARLEALQRVAGLLRNGATRIEAAVGYSSRNTVRPDRKAACAGCGERRSFTLMGPAGLCGLCVFGASDPERLDADRSRWCECRACLAHYAVVVPPHVAPKCHYCRLGLDDDGVAVKRTASCALCANRFLCQAASEHGDPFVCPPCEERGAAVTETISTTVQAYVTQNGAEFVAGLTIPDPAAFFAAKSLYAAVDLAALAEARDAAAPQTLGGKRVLNAAEVRDAVQAWVGSGDAERGLCAMCFEELPKARLLAACGRRRRCDAVACGACMDAWYGEPKPGRIVLTPNLRCPFCKLAPSSKTLRRHNRAALELRVPADADEAWYRGWCVDCYELRPAVPRACADQGAEEPPQVPTLTGFRCARCADARRPPPPDRHQEQELSTQELSTQEELSTKECPACTVVTQKVSGCNHVTCACGTHWCWACGHVADRASIYDHMHAAHGGIGLVAGDFDVGMGSDTDESQGEYNDVYDAAATRGEWIL